MTKFDIIKKYSAKIIDNIKESIDRKGLNASGKAKKSLKDESSPGQLLITGADHIYYMQNGRKPNRDKSLSSIRAMYPIMLDWVNDKGITKGSEAETKRFAYLAGRKIVLKGIDVPNKFNPGGVVSDVVNDKILDDFSRELQMTEIDKLFARVRSDIINI